MKNVWQEPAQNYYRVPCKLFSLGLTFGEIAVYTYLLSLMNPETGCCHPSYGTIGKRIGMGRKTVQKYVRGLEEKGLISTEPTDVITKSGVKRNGNLRYTIMDVQEVIADHERQETAQRFRAEEVQRMRSLLGSHFEVGDESA